MWREGIRQAQTAAQGSILWNFITAVNFHFEQSFIQKKQENVYIADHLCNLII
jgi:hypothetical protein